VTRPVPHRPLSDAEIQILVRRGCSAAAGDWSGVRVADGFDPERLAHVHFAGQVQVGALNGRAAEPTEPGQPAEIQHARLINCRLGDNVRIVNVGKLANYEVGEGACIEDVGLMESRPAAKFGNGVEVDVLNEAGGREVLLFNELSSQFAHLMCLHRYRPGLIEALREIGATAARQVHTDRGQVGAGAQVALTTMIQDVHIGPRAVVQGAASLINGSILSQPQCPTTVGTSVQAHDFIVAEGAVVDSGALISKTYVGQGCRVGRQFSAENCLMFANCEAFHGEACSVLFGPYSVTHHKSSLLIAGMFSFYNAGSGTNQSNHMYKLGPVHEGKLERGCKTGSFAYLMWPCRVGPFSVVLGKHTRTFDTADLPFSHIEATADGRSSLIPGFNLMTVGTVRDGAKWASRDRRQGLKRDRVSCEVFSPLTIGRMLRGLKLLHDYQQTTERSVDAVAHQGVEIKRVFLRTGQKNYRRALQMALAEKVVDRVETRLAAGGLSPPEALASPPHAVYSESWVDIGGQLMPAHRLEQLCTDIAQRRITDVTGFQEALQRIEQAAADDEWVWVKQAYRRFNGTDLDAAGPAELETVAETWLAARREFLELVLVDATKEFETPSRIGFGMDGEAEAAEADFRAVRGDYEANRFVQDLRQQIAALTGRVAEFKQLIGR
jgi:hypothetical protein